MKKKHRDIVVNDITYGWTFNKSGKEYYIRIWKDKKIIHSCTVRIPEITPALIADIIKDYLKNK